MILNFGKLILNTKLFSTKNLAFVSIKFKDIRSNIIGINVFNIWEENNFSSYFVQLEIYYNLWDMQFFVRNIMRFYYNKVGVIYSGQLTPVCFAHHIGIVSQRYCNICLTKKVIQQSRLLHGSNYLYPVKNWNISEFSINGEYLECTTFCNL